MQASVDGLLADARRQTTPLPECPKALIVPHAGYIYSGPSAARAYALLDPFAASVRRVVLLGPAHHVWLTGLALPDDD
ncbi:AmmeMemoRadiSam system protein B, partial [Sedimentibacter sp. B4]|uniref:AmmeMemoRadiSam system protein B n=1 Tax=Sedimentibacter sp. B4 TaxID=304766 RepID=UPI0009FF4400